MTDDSILSLLSQRFGDVAVHPRSASHRSFRCARPDGSTWEIRIPAVTDGTGVFKEELSLIGSLDHSHIVRVLDHGTVGAVPFYAVDLRPDLFDALQPGGSLPAGEVLGLLRDLASALECCHEQGVLLRAISPLDIRCAERSYLLDGFSLAATFRQVPDLEEVALGNPTYFSPELCRGASTDERSDIYSLGAVAYLCLEGVPANQGKTPFDMIMRKQTDQPRVSENRTRENPELARLVESMLAPEPSDRPQSARELRHATSSRRES